MHQFSKAGLAVAALLLGASASAQVAGTFSVRAGFTHIAPQVRSGDLSAPSFPGTKVDVGNATSLSGGVNYMLTNHWAVDVPLALPFKHEIEGDGAIAGVGKLGETKVLPVTVFAQYRFAEPEARFRPYGPGPDLQPLLQDPHHGHLERPDRWHAFTPHDGVGGQQVGADSPGRLCVELQ